MAVRIRLKKLGRKHRPFYRICAMDAQTPRDGRVLEELGTYDPLVPETDARAIMDRDRIDYWLGVGAQPTDKVGVLIKKYGTGGTHVDAQKAALDRLAQPAPLPDPGKPASLPKKPEPKKEEEAAPQPDAKAPSAKKAAEKKPAEKKPADEKPADEKAAEEKPAEEKPAAAEKVEETVEVKPEASSADDKPTAETNEEKPAE